MRRIDIGDESSIFPRPIYVRVRLLQPRHKRADYPTFADAPPSTNYSKKNDLKNQAHFVCFFLYIT